MTEHYKNAYKNDSGKNIDMLIEALRWQVEMGIDVALMDEPTAKMKKQTSIPCSEPIQQALQKPTKIPAETKTADLLQNLKQTDHLIPDLKIIDSLDALKECLAAFEGCALKKTASNLVFCDGANDADIMLIGEAPGRDEDRMGLPFVGAAGQLLDKMLTSIGLSRADVYITNILPWRPPGNRTPSPEETAMMWPFLKRHIQLKAPKIIFALGGSAAKLLLNTTAGITKLRGKLCDIDFSDEQNDSQIIPVLPSLHPAYLLRQPAMKKQAFIDLLTLKKLVTQKN